MSDHTYNQSVLRLIDYVQNTSRDFGEGLGYYQVFVQDGHGNLTPALFTQSQVDAAVQRASENTEDLRPALASVPALYRWLLKVWN